MSLVACVQCGKQISSQALMCLHCGTVKSDITDDQQLTLNKRKIREKIYHLNMFSYAVMTVFGVGFAWYWVQSGGFFLPTGKGPFYVMGSMVLVYLGVRVMLVKAQREQRALNKIRFDR